MDIDDILREVDPVSHSVPAETRDLQVLTRAWVAERSAPELLESVLLSPDASRKVLKLTPSVATDGPRTGSSSA